ncbi:MAG TPA: YciI family protein, partial [Dehalococcoidia bacterium]
KMVSGDPLASVSSATTVRLQNGAPVMTDGPFAETKEQLGGYFIVEADNLDEALAWAKKMPNLPDGGCVEVRAIPNMM